MSHRAGALRAFLATATSGETLLQVAAISVALLMAMLASKRLRSWQPRRPPAMPSVRGRLLEISMIEAPLLLALLLLLILRTLIAALDAATGAIDTAMQLTATLIIVRLGMYLVRLVLGPDSW